VTAPNYCKSRLDDEPRRARARPAADNAARGKKLSLRGRLRFPSIDRGHGTHAEYDRIDALKVSRRSVR
jgi:hypothetical protein